ncbi:P-loop containing nucleoside triphosphate hydrolase protein [Colletotrichum phormii]|uniref:P-loop containing nucleoside triphosphate hydrolase protein n=1 Tax=Colletotrichum phormii TaxID=359342 RepID=A0AAJ0ECU0_9PEZI|nr:P-loop containing nucleoside triphosphate hydrolase protein [Colletotrichum phormii]KAK1635152.1 P-loop containing nucleoside triphosphate hydrolase protein [Colletotrichum phormii]
MANSTSDGCSLTADDAFGPIVQHCRDGFDFTLTLEQCLFTILPASLLILIAPLRFRYLGKLPYAVNGTTLRLTKQAAIALLAILQLVLLGLWSAHRRGDVVGNRLRAVSVAASCASFAATVMFAGLSYIEHAKSLKPSSILNTYILVSLVLDGAILRTMWLSHLSVAISAVFAASFACKTAIVILEAQEKTRYLVSSSSSTAGGGGRSYSPEETSGIYSRGLFWWLTPLLLTGFRRLLKSLDLFVLDGCMSAAVLNERFWLHWNKSPSFSTGDPSSEASRSSRYRLIRTCIVTLKWQLLAVVLPRLFLLGFTICQPLILNRFLEFLQNPSETVNYGYGLIGAYGFVYLGISISSSFYWHAAFRCLTMLRGFLVAAIYTKTTELRVAPGDDSAAVTLMSTDVDAIIRAWREVHEFWANTIQIALATWILSTHLGYAASGPIIVSVFALGATVFLAPSAQKCQIFWVEKVQKRIGITSAMIGHIKSIKMSGLTQKLSRTLADLRLVEMRAATPFRVIGAVTSAVAQVPLMIAPVVAFAMYTTIASKNGQVLDATKLFAALSLIILLAQPLFWMFEVVLDMSAALGCFNRIEKYLSEPPRAEYRDLPSGSPASSSERTGSHSQDVQLQNLESSKGQISPDTKFSGPIAIRVKATLAWKPEAVPAVDLMDFSISRGQLVMLVGPVASGKSTLLKGLLGELPHVTGTVALSSDRVSWCEQSPWLINETVRKNIICFSDFDQKLYQQVLNACDLEKELAQLPDGDESLIGSKGIALSGGQKQRVALARAIYSRPQIALFDDIFSGLDNHTARTVFQRVFGAKTGIFRTWGTTIILATQSVSFLSQSDMIIALESGKIAEKGSFGDCLHAKGYVSSLISSNAEKQDESSPQPEEPAGRTTSDDPIEKRAKTVKQQDDKRRQLGDWSVYGYYFGSVGASLVAVLMVLEVTWAFFSTFPTVWLKFWTDSQAESLASHDAYYLGVYAAFQVSGVLCFAVLIWFVLVPVASKSGISLHQRLLKAVMHAPLSLFTKTDTGSITTRFSQDVGLIDRSLPLALVISLASFFTCIGKAFLIASASWYIAISFPVLILVFYYIQRAYLRTSRQLRLLDLEEKAPVYTHFLETLSGLPTLRAQALTTPSITHAHALIDRSQRPFYILLLTQQWLTLVLDLTTTALALLVVGLAVRLRDTVSVALTGVSLVQLISFTETLKMLIQFWTSLETSIGAVARIKNFAEETPDEVEADALKREALMIQSAAGGQTQKAPETAIVQGWPSRGAIELHDVVASYDQTHPDTDTESHPAATAKALDGITLSLPPASKTGIVGRTGSGKSSLLLALLRLLPLSSGTISIDGIPIDALPLLPLRSALVAITQDQFVLPGTVRQNLDPLGLVSDAEADADANNTVLVSVLTRVGLWDTIRDNGGLEAQFAEEALSHGQRQLFFLARAILRKDVGRVLLLDEATSSVDAHTERMVKDLIREEFKHHTIIAIAHRLDTVIDFDRVVVLDKGRVVEVGNPRELLDQRQGRFRELWDASRQAGGQDA